MRLEVKKLLQDMLDAARDIASFVEGVDLVTFSKSEEKRLAVYFKFVVISEALTQIKHFDASVAESITDARKITGFRNLICPRLRQAQGRTDLGHNSTRPSKADRRDRNSAVIVTI